jgi:WD40 repeat protein
MILRGHTRRVTCLLYPHGDAGGAPAVSAGVAPTPRYPANQLVSGGADFAVIIWDLTTGAQLTRFVVQAGPVLQLMTTPSTCSVSAAADDHTQHLLGECCT